jgi:hypothetical protein
MRLSFSIAAGPRQHSNSQVRVLRPAHILLSHIRDSFNLQEQVPVFISPRNRMADYTPWHWVPFSLPLMTRSTKVEVCDLASTRVTD